MLFVYSRYTCLMACGVQAQKISPVSKKRPFRENIKNIIDSNETTNGVVSQNMLQFFENLGGLYAPPPTNSKTGIADYLPS